MKFQPLLILIILLSTSCSVGSGEEKIVITFQDQETNNKIIHEWSDGDSGYQTLNTLKLEAYTSYNVTIEKKETPIDKENDCYVVFENFDVAINFARMDRDAKNLPVGIKSFIKTFAPGEGSFRIVIKEETDKANPYNSGITIADLNTKVNIH